MNNVILKICKQMNESELKLKNLVSIVLGITTSFENLIEKPNIYIYILIVRFLKDDMKF